ncbi:MAG: NYN domain-containing protein [Candidatus Didemnitutus sp.]|nr:NYN domain-containing protein [Candidatus Didemnitutus sp.]
MNAPAPRVMFFFDGFNLYHSLEAALRAEAVAPVKWLDLSALATAHLYTQGTAARLAGVHFFTAYAEHLALTKPERLARHRAYVRALTATGVRVHFGHFKPKNIWVESLQDYARIWQEKATDVHIVAQVFAHAARDEFDTAIIVSGDADYAPVVPVFQELFPGKRLRFGFPFDRKNKELARLVPASFTLSRESYAQNQFPEAVRLPSGKFVVCPHSWRVPPAAPTANPSPS